MMPMPRRSFFRFSILAAVIGLLLVSLAATAQSTSKRGRKYKAPPLTARIEVTVLRDVNGKPIENAAVIFHPMEGERDKGNMELKTNEDGKTLIDVLPIGDVVRLQIIAKGFQTYGEDFKIDKPEMAVEIRLKRPGEQYSIYKMHSDKAKPATPSTDSGKDATPKDKPAAQPDAPSSQPK
jgi:5-hydroxyisourate hydrolase-like protein (transthyretin family)